MPWQYARHGQPEKDYLEIDYEKEHATLDLGADGKAQSRLLGLHNGPFQIIAHSPLTRAASTAAIVRMVQGGTAELVPLPDLREVNFGGDPGALDEWVRTGTSPRGEPVSEVRLRVQAAMRQMLKLGMDVRGLAAAHKLLYSVILLEEGDFPLDTPVADLWRDNNLGYAECVPLRLELVKDRLAD